MSDWKEIVFILAIFLLLVFTGYASYWNGVESHYDGSVECATVLDETVCRFTK